MHDRMVDHGLLKDAPPLPVQQWRQIIGQHITKILHGRDFVFVDLVDVHIDRPLRKLLRVSIPVNLPIAPHQERPLGHGNHLILGRESRKANRSLPPLASPFRSDVGDIGPRARPRRHS